MSGAGKMTSMVGDDSVRSLVPNFLPVFRKTHTAKNFVPLNLFGVSAKSAKFTFNCITYLLKVGRGE